MGKDNFVRFLKIHDAAIINFICAAQSRIIIAKPAYSVGEIEALIVAKRVHNVQIDLYMEPEEKAIRLGFGDKSALDLIKAHIPMFNIMFAERIRMAILCFDENAILYAPTLSFSESETTRPTFANGILCGGEVARVIIDQFPVLQAYEKTKRKTKDNVLILPGGYIPDETINKLQVNMVKTIARTIANLEESPPVDPSQLRKISIYRNKYKIVHQKINGVKIERKTINLKPFYTLLPATTDKLHSSWTIFRKKDLDDLRVTKQFYREFKRVEDKYADSLLDAGRFGKLLEIKKKTQYLEDMTQLVDEFKAYLAGELGPTGKNRFFRKGKDKKKGLAEILSNSRRELEDYLVSLCPENDKFMEMVYHHYEQLRDLNGVYGKKAIIEQFVHRFVVDKLKIVDVKDIVDSISATIDLYDISDELMASPDFTKVIENHELNVRQITLGFEPVQE